MQSVEQCTLGLRSAFEYLVTRSIISYPASWSEGFTLENTQQQIHVPISYDSDKKRQILQIIR